MKKAAQRKKGPRFTFEQAEKASKRLGKRYRNLPWFLGTAIHSDTREGFALTVRVLPHTVFDPALDKPGRGYSRDKGQWGLGNVLRFDGLRVTTEELMATPATPRKVPEGESGEITIAISVTMTTRARRAIAQMQGLDRLATKTECIEWMESAAAADVDFLEKGQD